MDDRRSKAKDRSAGAVVVGATVVGVPDLDERTADVEVGLPVEVVVELTAEEEIEVSVVVGAV